MAQTPAEVLDPINTRGAARRALGPERNDEERDEFPTLAHDHPLSELWVTFAEFYGSAWESQYGDTPTWTWLGVLDGLSAADYGVGILACKDRDEAFPPNPAQFLAMCRPESPAQRRNRIGSERHPAAPALPNPNAILTPEQAAPYIARMREGLMSAGGKHENQ